MDIADQRARCWLKLVVWSDISPSPSILERLWKHVLAGRVCIMVRSVYCYVLFIVSHVISEDRKKPRKKEGVISTLRKRS